MKVLIRNVFLLCFLALFTTQLHAQVQNFSLEGVQGENITLSDFASKKAIVVVFTSSHCSYSSKYEARLKALYKKYASTGIQFLAINSNDASMSQNDAVANLRRTQPYPFPHLKDVKQEVARLFKATKNPEVFVLIPKGREFHIVYKGQIDDNPLSAEMVTQSYLDEAISHVVSGKTSALPHHQATGCNIKWIR